MRNQIDLAPQGYGAKTIVRRLIAENRNLLCPQRGWSPEYVTSILKNRAILGYFQPHNRDGLLEPIYF